MQCAIGIMDSTVPVRTHSTFLALPAEIRHMIYHELLTLVKMNATITQRQGRKPLISIKELSGVPTMALTCHAVLQEMIYSMRNWQVCLPNTNKRGFTQLPLMAFELVCIKRGAIPQNFRVFLECWCRLKYFEIQLNDVIKPVSHGRSMIETYDIIMSSESLRVKYFPRLLTNNRTLRTSLQYLDQFVGKSKTRAIRWRVPSAYNGEMNDRNSVSTAPSIDMLRLPLTHNFPGQLRYVQEGHHSALRRRSLQSSMQRKRCR